MSGIIANTPQGQCAYNASKGGVIMLTKSLASEWVVHNIRVNTIAPGYMKTELTRLFFEQGDPEMIKKWMDFLSLIHIFVRMVIKHPRTTCQSLPSMQDITLYISQRALCNDP